MIHTPSLVILTCLIPPPPSLQDAHCLASIPWKVVLVEVQPSAMSAREQSLWQSAAFHRELTSLPAHRRVMLTHRVDVVTTGVTPLTDGSIWPSNHEVRKVKG